jgi:RNA polymerase sigma-70 factor, ECF subfamily
VLTTSYIPSRAAGLSPRQLEAQLIARVRAGDESACRELVEQFGPRMRVVASRFLRCPGDCDDAVQDAFVSALKSIGSFAGGSSLSTWLHRITVNACLMLLRRKRDEVSIDALLPRFASDGHHASPVRAWEQSPLDSADALEKREIVRSCIDTLPSAYRQVLLLRDIEQLDTSETARLLECSEANVKTRLHRARQALRTLLEKYNFTAE